MRISDWISDVCSSDLYSPIPDIKFRVNYSHSVRAPALGDLYASPSQDFASVDDPCDVNFIDTGTANRPANCAAAGVPPAFANPVTRAATQIGRASCRERVCQYV